MCIRSHWIQKCSTLKIQPELSSHWLISELSWLGSGMCRSALFWLRRNLGGRTWHRSRLNMLTGYWQFLSLFLGWFSFSGSLSPHGALPTLLHLLQRDLWEGWPKNLGTRGLCKTCGEGERLQEKTLWKSLLPMWLIRCCQHYWSEYHNFCLSGCCSTWCRKRKESRWSRVITKKKRVQLVSCKLTQDYQE